MDVYRRYFKVTEGPVIAAVKEVEEINDIARKEYRKIIEEIGAKPEYYTYGVAPSGFIFEKTPDSGVFKKTKNGGYYPKKNCKEGRELTKRIESIVTKSTDYPLTAVGLNDGGFPRIFGANRAYKATIVTIPQDPPVVYISIPWYDEDPDVIEKYKADRAAGAFGGNRNIAAILWEPTADMVEVKKWEVDRHIEEWNESVKK